MKTVRIKKVYILYVSNFTHLLDEMCLVVKTLWKVINVYILNKLTNLRNVYFESQTTFSEASASSFKTTKGRTHCTVKSSLE